MKKYYPCDMDGICPYDAEYIGSCECFCGLGVDEDGPDPEDMTDYSTGSADWLSGVVTCTV